MDENWDVRVIQFEDGTISDDWSPLSLDSNYQYNFEEITGNLKFLNGTYYEIADDLLTSYGGGGYGTFDWKEITRPGETISVVATSCVGHCGGITPVNYAKNVFDTEGKLNYIVSYPEPDQNIDPDLRNSDNSKIEKFLLTGVAPENQPDTIQYYYDQNKLYAGTEVKKKISPEEIIRLFSNPVDENLLFHQCYVNDIPMEEYFVKLAGYTPRLVLIEIYRYGVFAFMLHTNGKYYRSRDVVLEQ